MLAGIILDMPSKTKTNLCASNLKKILKMVKKFLKDFISWSSLDQQLN